MLIDQWLDLPIGWMVFAVAALFGSSAAALGWLCHGSPVRGWIARCSGVVAPFFTAVSVLFALFLAFLAADVWDRKAEAHRTVLAEQDAVLALLKLTAAGGPDGATLHAAALRYLRIVVHDEWPRMADQESSPEAAAALDQVLREAARPEIAGAVSPAVHAAMVQKALRLREARRDRLSLSEDRAEGLKWLSVLILAGLTQLAVAVVHLERARPQAMALAIFTVAAVVALAVVAAYERPFDGPVRIGPDPLAEALRLAAPEPPAEPVPGPPDEAPAPDDARVTAPLLAE